MMGDPIKDCVISTHALFELNRRGLSEGTVRAILLQPEQSFLVRPGRVVVQSRMPFEKDGKIYLVRVFVDVDRNPSEVVTGYRTSRISKYWRKEQ